MKRLTLVLVALLLVSGMATSLAYGGFDSETGTGVIGVGQVQPPGRGEPPSWLFAIKRKTTHYTWVCEIIENDVVNRTEQWGWYSQDYVANAEVQRNPRGRVLNYRFVGWLFDATIKDRETNSWGFDNVDFPEPLCDYTHSVEDVEITITYDDVFFWMQY